MAQSLYNKLRAKARIEYEEKLAKIDVACRWHDVGSKAAAAWTEITGQEVKADTYGFNGTGILFGILHKVGPLGRKVKMNDHGLRFIEAVDEIVEASGLTKFETFDRTVDDYQIHLRWGRASEDGGQLDVYLVHGGNCRLVPIETKTYTNTVYEMECD